MRVDLTGENGLNKAIDKVKEFASDTKMCPGIMFMVKDGAMYVCYHDGKKAICTMVQVILEEGEGDTTFIVGYNPFTEVLATCQGNGAIYVNEITMKVEANGVLKFEAEKKLEKIDPNDESCTYEDVMSVVRRQIAWNAPNADVKQAILTRMNYEELFNAQGGDEWDRKDLSNTLDILSREDGKFCYISSRNKAAFVNGLLFLSVIDCEYADKSTVCTTNKLAKQLSNILGKCNDDTVRVVSEQPYCTVLNESETTAVWFEMQKGERGTLNAYDVNTSKKFESLGLVLCRPAIEDVIKNCISCNKTNDVASMEINEVGDNVVVKFTPQGSKNKEDALDCKAEQLFGTDIEKVRSAELAVALTTVSKMLANCKSEYIELCIDYESSVKIMRISDIGGKDADGNIIRTAKFYTTLR